MGKHHTMWANIEFMGCFDTVAALGIPQLAVIDSVIDNIPFFKHKFHNFRLSGSVIRAYHALAIDDERKTFHPVLWKGQDENKKNVGQRVTQVWFCGMHTDVGGGYPEQNLSNIPLVWMIEKAVKYGILLYIPYYDSDDPKNLEKIEERKKDIAEDFNGKMHNSREGTFEKFYRQETRYWDGDGMPWVHQSVKDRADNPKNNYHPWILEQYKDKDYRLVEYSYEYVMQKYPNFPQNKISN